MSTFDLSKNDIGNEFYALYKDTVTGERVGSTVVTKLSDGVYYSGTAFGIYKATIFTEFDLKNSYSTVSPRWEIEGKTYLKSEVTEPIMKIVKKYYKEKQERRSKNA